MTKINKKAIAKKILSLFFIRLLFLVFVLLFLGCMGNLRKLKLPKNALQYNYSIFILNHQFRQKTIFAKLT